jgi:hypothetical protein
MDIRNILLALYKVRVETVDIIEEKPFKHQDCVGV